VTTSADHVPLAIAQAIVVAIGGATNNVGKLVDGTKSMKSAFVRVVVATQLLAASSMAIAADSLKFGPTPSWVIPTAVPVAPNAPADAPLALLLTDHQIVFEPGKTSIYSEVAMKVQTAQGLAAGNISIPWSPATDAVTVHKLHIRRDDKIIDVLASGQTFTTLRRESNLEAAMLDGRLTANIQPEGLQVGDTVILATTVEHSDPVLKGHVEAVFATWNGTPIKLGRARLIWAEDMRLKLRQSSELPSTQPALRNGKKSLQLELHDIEPIVPPKGAPLRFAIGRIAEASDFASWAEVAELLAPLYRSATVIPEAGPLRDELERIRAGTRDQKVRAGKALALVQDRVRYVALLMGQGGYVPTSAETTWSRRFGDCKGKTALLLALLGELGIEAEPVAVNSSLGDAIPDRLPMLSLFDHVLVRARIGGKYYWLDGTRAGDTSLDRLEVPNFGWGLPLVGGAEPVRIMPAPLAQPTDETIVNINASGGAYALAPTEIVQVLRGDEATEFGVLYSSLTGPQRDELMRVYWKRRYDFLTVKSTQVKHDKQAGELRLSVNGESKLDWAGNRFWVPDASIGHTPDFERAAGPLREVPFAVAYPRFDRARVMITLPTQFAGKPYDPAPIRETLAGVEYWRTTNVKDAVFTMEAAERSLVPEVPFRDAIAAESWLRALADDDLALRLPPGYRPTAQDIAAIQAVRPASVDGLILRGNILLNERKFDEALADFNEALRLEPKNTLALANRAISLAWKKDYAAAELDIASLQATDPANAVAWRARGLMAEQKSEYQAAANAYSESLKSDPSNGFALGHRAYAFSALREYDRALADSEAALKADPSWMDLRVMRANILVGRSEPDAAAMEGDLLIAQNPQSDFAHVAAARIYARVGRRDKAMKAFDRAIAIKPQGYIYLNRAQSRPFSDYAGRLADLDEALKIEPDNPYTLAEKAEQLAVTGDIVGALQLYDKAVRFAPDDRQLATGRAIALFKSGKVADAEKIFADVRSQAKTASDFNSLCWAKATKAILLETALADCQEALRLKPDAGAYLDSLGMVLLRLGKFDEALAAYDKAVAKDTGSASLMGRALVYTRKGDKARAETDRAKAIKLDPDAETRFAEFGLRL